MHLFTFGVVNAARNITVFPLYLRICSDADQPYTIRVSAEVVFPHVVESMFMRSVDRPNLTGSATLSSVGLARVGCCSIGGYAAYVLYRFRASHLLGLASLESVCAC